MEAGAGTKIVCILIFAFSSAVSRDWSYSLEDDNGQDRWSEKYPTCSGAAQSPIALWLDDLEIQAYTKAEQGIRLHNYETAIRNSTILNNGHTVVIKIPQEYGITLASGHLPDTYRLDQLHFHWGQEDDEIGSEHTIGRGRHPLEMHLVHVNEKTGQPKAVLGVFYQLIESDETSSPFMNPQMEGIVKQFQQVRTGRSIGHIADYIRVSDLLPRSRDNFVHYNGSLTTPPCTEGILWTIFTQVQHITRHQLEQFRMLRGQSKTDIIGDNFRLTQPLNGRRVVLYTYQPSIKTSGATTTTTSFYTVICSVLFMSLVSVNRFI